jgi:hypothetical protein
MGGSMTRRLSSVPRLGTTAALTTTDANLTIPANVYQVKVFVDQLARVRVDNTPGAIVPTTTNMGYMNAGSEEVWDIRPGEHTTIHIASAAIAGLYIISYYS